MKGFCCDRTVHPGGSLPLPQRSQIWWVVLCTGAWWWVAPVPTHAQSVTPASDGTGSVVTQTGDQYTISGGSLSRDGSNLFHSLQRLGLNPSEIANFVATPALRNILGRVVGGEPSYINGLIQVTGGTPNLYLVNPAGIVFGSAAQLNVPAAFTATTADRIGINCGTAGIGCSGWFNAAGQNNYADLVGTPNAFAFGASQPGSIANFGNLAVGNGQSLTLLGGTVLNAGTLTAPNGQITIAAVPGSHLVRLSQPGSLLSLELSPLAAPVAPTVPIPSLPQLLTGGNLGNATGITVNPDGSVQLNGSTVPTAPGTAIARGQLSVASTLPTVHTPQIAILGDRVSVQAATLDASGANGGTIRIGGDYLGQGTIPNAQFTDIDANTVIRADAIAAGNGGRVIVWADDTTNFAGTITARGGGDGGNGGFVETSGQRILNVAGGRVDASAVQGTPGTWLLDPTDIDIVNGGGGSLVGGVFDPPTNSTISPATIAAALDGGTNVTITTNTGAGGNGDITLTDPINQAGGGTASLTLTGRRFLLPGTATINMTSTGGLTVNLNQVNPEAAPPSVSIQNAINAIGSVAGSRTINLGTGTYTLGATINIDRSLTMNGVDQASTTVSGNNAVQVFNVSATNVTLNNLTIANANSGINGGGVGFTSVGGTLTINNSTFSNNRAVGFAGGLDNGNGGTITVNNSTFTGNSATNGGAISNGFNGGIITVNNSTFTGNSATNNGGAIINNAGFGTVTVNASNLSGNSAFNDGGGIFNIGTLTVNNSTLSGNSAQFAGGIRNDGTSTVTNTIIINNNVSRAGGAIYNAPIGTNAVLRLTNSTISGNRSDDNGGAFENGPGGTVIITDSTITNNIATNNGGSFYNYNILEISGSTFAGNTSTNGGGIFNIAGGTLAVSNSALSNNTASLSGGGIFNLGTLTVSNSTLSGNSAISGGGIYNNGGTATVTGSTISGNSARGVVALAGGGGGLYNDNGGRMTVNNSSIQNNTTTGVDGGGSGGGLYNTNSSTLIVNSSTISNNIADTGSTGNGANGGGIFTFTGSGSVTVNNSTISGNIARSSNGAPSYGGGIYNFSDAFNIVNTTFANNTADTEGGGIFSNAGSLTLSNSIVASNNAPTGREIRSLSATTSGGNNLFGLSGDAGLVGVTLAASDIVPTAPLSQILAPLGNYGGTTQTHALVPGSPAINAGGTGATATDQRGVAAVGVRDIGAYESAGFVWLPVAGNGQSTLINTTFATLLQVQLAEAAFNQPIAFANIPVTFSLPVSGASGVFNGAATVVSNAQGIATSPFLTANGIAGNFTIAVSSTGISGASFILSNRLPPPPAPVPPPAPAMSTPVPVDSPAAAPLDDAAIAAAKTTQQTPDPPVPLSTVLIATGALVDVGFEAVETVTTGQFTEQLELTEKPRTIRLPEAQNTLHNVATASGVRPALIYVSFIAPAEKTAACEATTQPQVSRDPATGAIAIAGASCQTADLQVMLLTPNGTLIRKRIPDTTRQQVLEIARRFRNEVADPSKTRTRSYLATGQQLHRWLIEPLEADLKANGIGTLVFIMDSGLRGIPLAALHDGQRFLVERYSLGLMPSLSLTDTRYVDVRSMQVLAAGASEFADQSPLPAVPVELAAITRQWDSQSLVEQAFTVDNLIRERQQRPFGIVHLATHGEFMPGAIANSYIQLANTRLTLDQLRQLGWADPPVELVVLSACEMAIGDDTAELGFAGFAVKAGAKSALASLWSINDQSTAGLMARFYEALRQQPIKAEALRQAQLDMINGKIRVEEGKLIWGRGALVLPPELGHVSSQSLVHPYYWSAFTLVGSPW